jgi:siroheme synthase (precorrin-2 oxidase/ferrochelatase)
MSSLPASFDLGSGMLALIGSRAGAADMLWRLRAAGANVRWFPEDVDVAEEVLLASAPPGRLELAFDHPLHADFGAFIAAVSAAGSPLDEQVAHRARAARIPIHVLNCPNLSTFDAAAVGPSTRSRLRVRLAPPRAHALNARR